ncbi:MAG: CRP/FNR family cyclic AMP-dependent transcriptional regulator [Alphaproteobacteria bacterium]|jgi:CRP-like cAMP-binding protein
MIPKFESALDHISIFQGLNDAERAVIARQCNWRRVAPREQVIGQMDTSTDVFFVVQGHLRAINFSQLGKQVSFVDVGPGTIVGEFAALDGEARSTNVLALDDAFIGSMSAESFWQAIEKHPCIAAELLKRLTGVIRQLNERVFVLSTMNVNNRIHAELLSLAHASGISDNSSTIVPTLTHAEIASRVGSSRETVSREINALAKAGVVRKDKRILIIQDVSWLENSVALELGEPTTGDSAA